MKTFFLPRRRLAALVTAGASVLLAATAFAAPAREGAVSAAAPVFAWDGGPHNGFGGTTPTGFGYVRCSPAYECEDTLVEVKDAGDLVAEIKAGEGSSDLDVAIYKSDADGATPDDPPGPDDAPLSEDISEGKDAKTTARKLKPGYYVVRVRFFTAQQGVYKGTASLKVPPPPVAPAPGAPAPAPPATAPASTPTQTKSGAKARKACIKKAKKKFKGKKNRRKRAKAIKRCKRIR
jgi:hypothetical protein